MPSASAFTVPGLFQILSIILICLAAATDMNSESSRVATVFDQMTMLFLNAPFLNQEHIVFAPSASREAARVVDGVASCITTNEQITQADTGVVLSIE